MSKTKNGICRACRERITICEKARCNKCRSEYHLKCIKIDDQRTFEKLAKWFCKHCLDTDSTLQIRSKALLPTVEQKSIKEKDYFVVEDILAWRNRAGTREFKVKWLGYKRESWEPETHLDGCVDLLQTFLCKNKLPLSTISALLGHASKDGQQNYNNWVSTEQIIGTVNRLRNMSQFKSEIKVEEFEKSINGTGIYIMGFLHHCYVLYHNVELEQTFIADGTNEFINNEGVQKYISDLISKPLKAINYGQQHKVDHCGSAAVAISLEFLRIDKGNKIPQEVMAPKSILDRIKKLLHPEKSQPRLGAGPHIEYITNIRRRCKTCNKYFSKRVALANHERFCNKEDKVALQAPTTQADHNINTDIDNNTEV